MFTYKLPTSKSDCSDEDKMESSILKQKSYIRKSVIGSNISIGVNKLRLVHGNCPGNRRVEKYDPKRVKIDSLQKSFTLPKKCLVFDMLSTLLCKDTHMQILILKNKQYFYGLFFNRIHRAVGCFNIGSIRIILTMLTSPV